MITTETKHEKGIGHCTKCICDNLDCQVEFWRRTADLNNVVNNRGINKQYCSRSCVRVIMNFKRRGKGKFLNQYIPSYNPKDELSPFRYFYNNTKQRISEGQINNLDIKDIKIQWENQDGVCCYTGSKLILPDSTVGFSKDIVDHFRKASLDRIDSSLPYIKDNIQFISQMSNLAKSIYNHDEMVKFCIAVCKKYNNISIDNLKINHVDYKPLTYFYRIINKRKEVRKQCFISIDDMIEKWESQQGLCIYTGHELYLPDSNVGFNNYNGPAFQKASLDRIDSSLPYTTDNIQFISQMANYAKNNYSHDEMMKFCQAIANHWQDK